MAVYHQMGHHSSNLLDLPGMARYVGAVFSPINYTQSEVAAEVQKARDARGVFAALFDPQLYVPASERGKLRKWRYFPKDVDSADLGSMAWWSSLNDKLASTCGDLKIDAVCSPATIPKAFDDKYYSHMVRVGNELAGSLSRKGIGVLQTVLSKLPELAVDNRALEIASIVSRTNADRVYVVLDCGVPPRRELANVDELVGAMRLINALERNGMRVLVAFCSSDVLLWKAAGASECASGKFFNLRRFTRQRFEEPGETGGGQLPYWFEEGLVAFLRQRDLILLRKHGLLSEASQRNPFGLEVLDLLDEATRTRMPLKPWLRLAWRQYLYWFAEVENRLGSGDTTAEFLLRKADSNWVMLDKLKFYMEERFNDGTWIRNWLNTLQEYQEPLGRAPH